MPFRLRCPLDPNPFAPSIHRDLAVLRAGRAHLMQPSEVPGQRDRRRAQSGSASASEKQTDTTAERRAAVAQKHGIQR